MPATASASPLTQMTQSRHRADPPAGLGRQFAIRTPSGRFGSAERVEFGSPVRPLTQDGDRPPSLRLDSGGDLDRRPGPLPDADTGHPREPDLAAGARDRQLTKTCRERRSLATSRPQRRGHNTDRVVRLEGDKRRCLPQDLSEPPLDRLTCPAKTFGQVTKERHAEPVDTEDLWPPGELGPSGRITDCHVGE